MHLVRVLHRMWCRTAVDEDEFGHSGAGPVDNPPLSVMAYHGHKLLFWAIAFLLSSSAVFGYEVPILDTDYSRQICSGMWSGQNTFINGMHYSDRLGSTC
jgi:hypothetical protein